MINSQRNNDKILEVKNLRISFKTNGGTVKAVRGISFSLYRGRTLAIVGESGSGKSVTSKAILGILANNKIIEDGQIIYGGRDLLHISEETFSKLRGVKLSMVFQDPLSSLNPIMIVGKQLTEALVLKQKGDKKEAHKLLHKIDEVLLKTHREEAEHFKKAVEESRDLSTFDLAPYTELFKAAVVTSLSEQKEAAKKLIPYLDAVRDSLSDCKTPEDLKAIVKTLKKLAPQIESCRLSLALESDNIIDVFPIVVKDIYSSYLTSLKLLAGREKDLQKYHVDDFFALPASLRAKRREVIIPPEEHLEHLQCALAELRDRLNVILEKSSRDVAAFTDRLMESYLHYVTTIKKTMSDNEAKEIAVKLLGEVGIDEPERRYKQYPFELSGGMRQRIVIAIALCSSPEVLICDEPTTALDVTIQSQILELINKLKKEKNLSIVFITHDLGVVANMADDIAVMYAGKIVEYGTALDIFYDPRHPYTWALLGSVPDLKTKDKLNAIPGTPPNMLLPPRGDAFALRNVDALEIDHLYEPPFFEVSPSHYAATWNLDDKAPNLAPTQVVIDRIKEALKEHPEYTPHPDNYKNSVLNQIVKGKKAAK